MSEDKKLDDLRAKYPGNSKRKEIKKVTKDTVIETAPSIGSRISNLLFADSLENATKYVVTDVIFPSLKNLLYDVATSGLKMLMFKEEEPIISSKNSGSTYVSYQSAFRNGYTKGSEISQEEENRPKKILGNLKFKTKGDAMAVLELLTDNILEFGQVSVADLYEAIGKVSEFTDVKYGWYNLSHSNIRRVYDGWILELPKPKYIE